MLFRHLLIWKWLAQELLGHNTTQKKQRYNHSTWNTSMNMSLCSVASWRSIWTYLRGNLWSRFWRCEFDVTREFEFLRFAFIRGFTWLWFLGEFLEAAEHYTRIAISRNLNFEIQSNNWSEWVFFVFNGEKENQDEKQGELKHHQTIVIQMTRI